MIKPLRSQDWKQKSTAGTKRNKMARLPSRSDQSTPDRIRTDNRERYESSNRIETIQPDRHAQERYQPNGLTIAE